jgi:hypothetical protein
MSPKRTWKGYENERDELARLGKLAKQLDDENNHISDCEMFQETIECLKDTTRESEFADFATVGHEIEKLSAYCVSKNIHSSLVYQAWADAINPSPLNHAITAKACPK